MIPNIQKQKIIDYLNERKRFDGRAPEEFRKIEIKKGISKKAEGSCSVKFGETEIYCGVKLEVSTPYPDSLDEGSLMVNAELGPIASPDFESGPPTIQAIELGRVIDRGIRESGLIDFKKLCIKEKEKVWTVIIDIYAVNDAGNIMDVAGLAALIALADAKMPVYDEELEKIDREKELTKKGLPLNEEAMAFNVTLHKIGNQIVADPVKEEQESSDLRISIAIGLNKDELRINSIQKGEAAPISQEDMESILNLIETKIKEIVPKIHKQVFG